MNDLKNFEMPNAEITFFEAEDVITTSTPGGGFMGEYETLPERNDL